MIIVILLSVLVVIGLLAGLSQRRAKRIQANANFAPTDHVELNRLGTRWGEAVLPTETHHDDGPSDFNVGD